MDRTIRWVSEFIVSGFLTYGLWTILDILGVAAGIRALFQGSFSLTPLGWPEALIAVVGVLAVVLLAAIIWDISRGLRGKWGKIDPRFAHLTVHYSQRSDSPDTPEPARPRYVVNNRTKQAYWASDLLEPYIKQRLIQWHAHDGERALRAYFTENSINPHETDPLPEELGLRLDPDGSLKVVTEATIGDISCFVSKGIQQLGFEVRSGGQKLTNVNLYAIAENTPGIGKIPLPIAEIDGSITYYPTDLFPGKPKRWLLAGTPKPIDNLTQPIPGKITPMLLDGREHRIRLTVKCNELEEERDCCLRFDSWGDIEFHTIQKL